MITPPEPPQERTTQDFIHGMMLISEKFVESKRDQASIRRILSNIKV